jgi:O-antigen/teichoic acid export membrane protein
MMAISPECERQQTPAAGWTETASAVESARGRTEFSQKAKSAVLWNVGFNLFRDVLQFVQMLVLARLLDQADYGRFAFVTSVIGFLSVFSFASFLSYTLQVKSDDQTHYQDHFTAGAALQLTMFLLANLIGLLMATMSTYEAAAPLIHVLSLTFLLDWCCELRRKMMERDLDFRRLRLLHGVGLLISTVLAIVMALTGCGVYSLVVPGMLVTIPFIWDLLVTQGWRPTWSFAWVRYRPAFEFGLNRIGSGMSIQGRSLIESSALAAVLGFGPLGVLNRAIGLANLACTKIASQLMYAIYPILTRIDENDGQAARVGDLLLRLVLWTSIPIATVLSWLALPVVETIYGPSWSGVVPLLKWTLLLAVISATTQVVYMLVLARSRARLCFWCDLIVLVGTVVCLIAALGWGVTWYLISLTLIQSFIGCLLGGFLLSDRRLTLPGVFRAILPAAVASGLGVLGASLAVGSLGWQLDSFVSALLWGCCFAVGYSASMRLLFSPSLEELVRYLPGNASICRLLRLKCGSF